MVEGQLKTLRITLEAVADGVLGYVYLRDIQDGQVAKTVEVEPALIMADYDADGHLLGVEFIDARQANAEVMRRLAGMLEAPELAGIDLSEMCKNAR
jgi:uncharacterized protein YuzE